MRAKFSRFGGWDMPLEYAGGGVLKEHAAVREGVGVFDVTHLGKVSVRGPGAADFLNRCLTNDLDRIGTGQAQYTMCCDDATGGVVDDLIAYRFGDDDVFLVPNAANTAGLLDRLQQAAPPLVTVLGQHQDYVVLAVQGPGSPAALAALGLPNDHDYMRFQVARFEGADVTVCRTGYTGERGYELIAPNAAAPALWDALIAADVRPCGLGARDTLRTEMGYALHGQDLSPSITPVMARSGWAVGWKKERFWGKEALEQEKAGGARRTMWGLEALDRAIPRPHMIVLRQGVPAGEVTSGTFSPTRRLGIALALLQEDYDWHEGVEVEVDVRGRRAPMKVVKPPFVANHTR
ncbi:aminomethyltransferase [Virgisporangium aurantiacum]|uniref:aminomethyltransferase n=1 Tax=Virgisporangium aurantiacum TaxID=175570 RepID=A0A8J3ZC55_9ACTN|nr:aminomethyltransferase [Virgisporangium aurantiacum]